MTKISWRVDLADPLLTAAVDRLRADLEDAGCVDAGWSGGTALGDVLAVWADRPQHDVEQLLAHDGVLLLGGPTLAAADPGGELAAAAGVVPGGLTPAHDVRLRAPAGGPLGVRLLDHLHSGLAHLGPHAHLRERVLQVERIADDVEPLLEASVGLQNHPVVSWRPRGRSGGVLVFGVGGTAASVGSRTVRRLLLLAIRHAATARPAAAVRVGLLGYGAIGHEHARAVRSVDGLELAAVCDTAPSRLDAAGAYSPGVRGHLDPDAFVDDPGVDLVVVSTPPASHAPWALRLLEAGKHVVVEKPFAITTAEADDVLALAATSGLLACVYQNRRFDPDYRTLRSVVQQGRIGTPFSVEAFVGGFGHPCNLWHSDDAVSGGAFYDWGAHVLDQVLDLVDDDVAHVSASTHKLRWHDVTNDDHSRVALRFAGGTEAEFVYSDLAAALKPRWYVLGTDGAVVGHWRTETVVSRGDVGTLVEDVLSPADSPPVMDLHGADGSVTRLAPPPAELHPFHTQLADQLQLGLAMGVTGAQSRRVLAVMEAARESAAQGGVPVVPR